MTDMQRRGSLLLGTAVAVMLAVAGPALAAPQLYDGAWIAESFGHDTAGGAGSTFEVTGIPLGVLCNPGAPVCPISQTPTDMNNFKPLGPGCANLSVFGTTVRPAKGGTAITAMGDRTPPLYRNPNHFTASGAPLVTACKGTQTIVQNGAPVSGSGIAEVTAGGAFTIPAAPATPGVRRGMRRSDFSGEFYNTPPYLYSYTYGTFRNDAGSFGPGQGPGDFSIVYSRKAPVAKAKVTAGNNQFGGVMRLLGKMTTRVCFFTKGACSIGGADWKYEVIGAAAYKSVGGAVTAPYTTTYTAIYFHTGVQQPYTLNMIGDRFPWTTGMVTLTAIASGPHPTLEVRTGYDNRTAGGAGTIQMVTPVLTHWLGATTIDTGGVGIVRFTFTPEPGVLAMLVAGLSLCGVLYRARGR
jgi:hypothetical protein